MESLLIKQLNDIDKLASHDDVEACIDACDRLIEKYPSEHAVYRKKADILEDFERLEDAYDVRKVLANLGFREPADLYELALSAWSLRDYYECIEWADRSIAECEENKEFYYYQASKFYKGVAEVAVGNYENALNTVSGLEDGYSTHVSRVGMVSKDDIVSHAESKMGWSEK